jgi:hypothetical protein
METKYFENRVHQPPLLAMEITKGTPMYISMLLLELKKRE